eukprot:gene8960-9136_t
MLDPGDVDNICRLAKQWSDLTYEPGATVEQIQEVNQRAIEYAERAITMAPKVRLAKEAQEAARTALQLEPQNDLAHHLMGRWHFEMAQINFVVRQLIRLVYGAALAPGRFEDALAEFEAAVAINPHKLIHRWKEDAELLLDKLKGEYEGKGSKFDAAVTWGPLTGSDMQQQNPGEEGQSRPGGAGGAGRQVAGTSSNAGEGDGR